MANAWFYLHMYHRNILIKKLIDSTVFRKDPWPGTGGNQRRRWYSLRHPKTTNEKRQWHNSREFVRGRRTSNRLPDAWEDIFRSQHKNWKHYRDKQYKVKDIYE